ncbi:Yqey-like protein [compost metagenome]
MNLLETIKNDSLQARRAKDSDKASTLTTLYSEAAMIGKNAGNRDTTDDEVAQTLKKFIKNAREAVAALEGTTEPHRVQAREALQREIVLYESYLPRQLDADQLKVEIDAIVATLADRSPRQMGVVMKTLKDKFAGNYDGAAASALVKAALA